MQFGHRGCRLRFLNSSLAGTELGTFSSSAHNYTVGPSRLSTSFANWPYRESNPRKLFPNYYQCRVQCHVHFRGCSSKLPIGETEDHIMQLYAIVSSLPRMAHVTIWIGRTSLTEVEPVGADGRAGEAVSAGRGHGHRLRRGRAAFALEHRLNLVLRCRRLLLRHRLLLFRWLQFLLTSHPRI